MDSTSRWPRHAQSWPGFPGSSWRAGRPRRAVTDTQRGCLGPWPSAKPLHLTFRKSTAASPQGHLRSAPTFSRGGHMHLLALYQQQMWAGSCWSQGPGNRGSGVTEATRHPEPARSYVHPAFPLPWAGLCPLPVLLLKSDTISHGYCLACRIVSPWQEEMVPKEPRGHRGSRTSRPSPK